VTRLNFNAVWDVLHRHRGDAVALRRLCERSFVPTIWFDNRAYHLDANAASRLFLRRTLDELRRMDPSDLLPPGHRDAFKRVWRDLRRSGAIAGSLEMLAPDGARIRIDYSGQANMLPGRHLFAWMPSHWPHDELATTLEHQPTGTSRLSPRERQVLALLAGGATIERIAGLLSMSPSTVKTHLRNALRRLGARHRVHALALALQRGELDLDQVAQGLDVGGSDGG
jgi:DNA-binding CsgD family transcriptional regulator